MKPTTQTSHIQHASGSLPLTDYSYQATADAKASSSPVLRRTKRPAFHKLSSEFFGTETRLDYIVELLFFILIIGIAAWPVVSSIVAVVRMIRNY